MSNHSTVWYDLDFRPDASGWRAVYLAEDAPGWIAYPIAGWLIQAQTRYSTVTFQDADDTPLGERYRRVVAAMPDGAEMDPVNDSVNFHRLLAPGEPDPTASEIAEALCQNVEWSKWCEARKAKAAS